MPESEALLKEQILQAVTRYYEIRHDQKNREFQPGDRIAYAGRVFDANEMKNLLDAALDFWLTAGKYTAQFEKELAQFLGVQYCALTNSGSSANLLALMALTSPLLEAKRRLAPGDEVITMAAGFPTTVAPIVQAGCIPVFVDLTLPTYNIDCNQLEAALSPKTKAVMIAHTLGNPFDLAAVKAFCDRHQLWLVEDNCDALGSMVLVQGKWRFTGTIGDLGTSSFYPPHHMTMGEGGAVYTNNPLLNRIVTSLRDWGRDCRCPSGQDNLCGKRFTQQFGALPLGYDHKYVYSHLGFNLKLTDLQAAIGCAQLQKLPGFIATRRRNWQLLREGLADLDRYFVLPEATPDTQPSWFGFLLTVKGDTGFTRNAIVEFLEANQIQTRMLFAGNLVKHPCFDEMRRAGQGYRVVGGLNNTDLIMERTFWVGVYPGITEKMARFMVGKIKEFVQR